MTRMKARLAQLAIPGVTAAWAIIQCVRSSGVATRYPDSDGYLAWASIRTPGYPFVLSVVQSLFGSVDAIVYVQIVLAAISLALLGLAIRHATRSVYYGLAIVFAVMTAPAFNEYHTVILTESIFGSIEMCYLAALIMALDRPRNWAIACLSLAAGCAIAVRPPGYAFVPLLAFILLPYLWRERLRAWPAVAAAIVPVIVVLTLASIAQARYATSGASLIGRVLYVKSVLVNGQGRNSFPEGSPEHLAWDQADARGEEIRRLIAQAPTRVAKDFLLVSYEVFLQNQVSRYVCPQLGTLPSSEGERVMQAVGAARLVASPTDTLTIGLIHLTAMWGRFELLDPSSGAALEAYLAPQRPLPFDNADGFFAQKRDALSGNVYAIGPKIFVLRVLNLAMCLATIAIAAIFAVQAVRGRASSLLWMAGLSSLFVHGSLILVAFTNIGIPRYFFILWPAMMATLVLGGALILSSRKRYSTRTAR